MKKVYGKAMMAGWIMALVGITTVIAGISLGGSTGNTGFFALAMLGLVSAISGIVTLCVYASMRQRISRAFEESSPLLRFTISAQDYAPYVAAQAEEIRSANKTLLS